MLLQLLSSAFEGAAYLILLFGACFGAVVGVKLLNRKLRERENKPAQSEQNRENETPTAAKPARPRPRTSANKRTRQQKVYYIVERAGEDKAVPERDKTKSKQL